MRRFFKQLEFLFDGTQPPVRLLPPSALIAESRGDYRKGQSGLDRRCTLTQPLPDHALESQARELLHSLGASKLAREIRVEWNPRLKTCAGRADYCEKLISLNPLLIELGDNLAPAQSTGGRNLECIMHSRLIPHNQYDGRAGELECENHSSFPGNGWKLDGIMPSSLTNVAGADGTQQSGSVLRDEIDRTLRHELAHLLAQWRVGRRRIRPHGLEWRQACVDLGIADEPRCHNLPFAAKVYPPRYVYRCPSCKERFPRVRRIRRAIACLACCRAHNRGEFDPRFRLKLVSKNNNRACPL